MCVGFVLKLLCSPTIVWYCCNYKAWSRRVLLHKKATAKRVPTLKARASSAKTSKPTGEAAGEGKKRKERVKKTTARVLGRSSIMREPEEDEEEEDAAPAPKS